MSAGNDMKGAGSGARNGDPGVRHGSMPASVGKYRVDEVIGRGAIGIVYKGYDQQIDRPVAIKTLLPEILDEVSEELLSRFAVEARSAGRCLHPNIVTVFDFVEHEGAPYIVMEYVNAGTLENVIRSGALLPVRQIGEIVAQVLFALGYAHAKGVVHRDVKPANILCPSAASIKVSDFGLAHIEALNLTKPGGIGPIGTPNYMAPERFLGQPADARSDLFSTGVVLFELLTGAKPFVAADLLELTYKLMNEAPPPVQARRPELWVELDDVVRRALARKPEDRFQSTDEFIDALNRAIEARPDDHAAPLDLVELSHSSGKQHAPTPKGRLNQTMADLLTPRTIDALSQSLAETLGPIAPLLVKQASEESTDVDTLLSTLTRQCRTETEATRFRDAALRALLENVGSVATQIEEVISKAETMQRVIGHEGADDLRSSKTFVDALRGAVETGLNEVLAPPEQEEPGRGDGRPNPPDAGQRLDRTMADVLAPDTIDALSQSLARSLGPIARLLVKQASRESTNVDMLLSALTRQCRSETEAAHFRDSALRALSDSAGSVTVTARYEEVISQAEIRAVTEGMLPLIGPIARVLVARHAEKAVGRDDFYSRLADCIPNEQDKAKFLEIRAKIGGGGNL